MLDEHYSDFRDQVEMDLIDAYVGGCLTDRQRNSFDNRYLITLDRKRAVQAAWLSRAYRERAAQRALEPKRHLWFVPHLEFLGHKHLITATVAAMAIVVICIAESWIHLHPHRWTAESNTKSLARKRSQAAPSVENSPAATASVPPRPKRGAEVHLQLPSAGSRSERQADRSTPLSKATAPPNKSPLVARLPEGGRRGVAMSPFGSSGVEIESAPFPPIEAPAPPPWEPVVIRAGTTIDEVTRLLGQPNELIDLGTKVHYIYTDSHLIVTFTNDKVTDAR